MHTTPPIFVALFPHAAQPLGEVPATFLRTLEDSHTEGIRTKAMLKCSAVLAYIRSSRTPTCCISIVFLSQMLLQDTVKTESRKQGKDDSIIIWQSYAMEKLVILQGVIQELAQRKDQVPQLWEAANMILETSSGIRVTMIRLCEPIRMINTFFPSSKNHKKDFERLLGGASALVIVLWKSYDETKAKYHSLDWPPPKLRNLLDELVEYVACQSKLSFTN